MISKLVSTENGFYDFDITDAGSIRRVTISENIKKGDSFNIYYGDGHYTPHRKERCTWVGSNGIGGYLTGDVEKSVRKSSVYIGESIRSEELYKKVANKFCDCRCSEPVTNSDKSRSVLAVDLDAPDYGREQSRYIIFLTDCRKCKQPLTFGTGVGSFHSTGTVNLKHLAEKEARQAIDWNNTITSVNDI